MTRTPGTHDVALPAGGRLKLGVIADTHGRPHPDAARLVAAEAPDLLLHAGDIGDASCLSPFEAIAPLVRVRGNIDEDDAGPDTAVVRVVSERGETSLVIALTHIAVYGSRLRHDAHRDALHLGADLVVCGHSHVPLVARDRGLAIFNPGSCGPRRFALPITVGFIEISADGVAFRHVDCTTGERWRPAA